MMVLDILLVLAAAALLVPSSIFSVQCFAALLPQRRLGPLSNTSLKVVVMVPAHDESAVIRGTLKSLKAALADDDRLLVIADNCSDDTAQIAADAGAEVIERFDDERRGKGFALMFGVEHLSKDPPDVVVVVDADCRVSSDAIAQLVQTAASSHRPVQADYIIAPPKPSPLGAVSGLAILIKNVVRPAGLRRLGLPCHLTGSGMAFPWDLLVRVPPTGAYLVEDMLMGIELALMGCPPISCADAKVSSELPDKEDAAMGQRRRWEHGHLTTLINEGPRLIGKGLRTLRFDLFAMGLDLMIPPMALLVMLLVAVIAACVAAALLGASPAGAYLAVGTFCMVTAAVLAAWAKFGRQTIPARYLLAIPFYLAWKVPLYGAFLLRRGQKSWQRTERTVDDSDATEDSAD